MTGYEGHWLAALTRTVFAAKSGRCTIVVNPKSACSTLKFAIWRQEYAIGSSPWEPPGGHGGIHRPHDTPICKMTIGGLENALFDRPVFSIVRNPYTRILSAYLDKVAGNKKEKRHLLFGLGKLENIPISFAEFVHFICGQNSREMDAHYAPQAFLMQAPYVAFAAIGSVEAMETSVAAIMMAAYGVTSPVGEKDFRPHRTDAASRLAQYYTDDLAAKIRDRYQIDFETFGYSSKLADADLPPTQLDRARDAGAAASQSVLRPAIRAAVAEHDKKFGAAFDLLSSIPSDEPELDVSRARCLMGLKRHEEACALLQRAVARAGNIGRYWTLLSECLVKLKRGAEAAQAADKAASIAPYPPLLRRLIAAWNANGETLKVAASREKIAAMEALAIAELKPQEQAGLPT